MQASEIFNLGRNHDFGVLCFAHSHRVRPVSKRGETTKSKLKWLVLLFSVLSPRFGASLGARDFADQSFFQFRSAVQ
jgi:hypothetical protein